MMIIVKLCLNFLGRSIQCCPSVVMLNSSHLWAISNFLFILVFHGLIHLGVYYHLLVVAVFKRTTHLWLQFKFFNMWSIKLLILSSTFLNFIWLVHTWRLHISCTLDTGCHICLLITLINLLIRTYLIVIILWTIVWALTPIARHKRRTWIACAIVVSCCWIQDWALSHFSDTGFGALSYLRH